MRDRVLLIAGPTTAGKSAVAMSLADRHRGTVINADAMAVYRDLAILTGRPTLADEARVPHRLYGHRDAAEPYSVAHWLAEVGQTIDAVRTEGRLPIIVGGTGLYFKAMIAGLSDIPAVPAEVRARVRAKAEGRAAQDLHAELAARDPVTAARLRSTDPQRVLRALEVFEATGQPLTSFQARRAPPLLAPGSYRGVVLVPDRSLLREAIDRRFDRMMIAGALDEAAALAARGLDPKLPAMRALGIPPLLDYLNGARTLEEAVAAGKAQTRAYAKRQITFARHQLPDWTQISAEAENRFDALVTDTSTAGEQS